MVLANELVMCSTSFSLSDPKFLMVRCKVKILVCVCLLSIQLGVSLFLPFSYHKCVQERQGVIAIFSFVNLMLPVVSMLLRCSVSSCSHPSLLPSHYPHISSIVSVCLLLVLR